MKKLSTKLFLLFAIFLMSTSLKAQFNYFAVNATKAAETYIDLGTTGTAIAQNINGNPMTYDDDISALQDIGFTFTYNGNAFTKFYLASNGYIVLTNTAPTGAPIDAYQVLANATVLNALAPFNYDLIGSASAEYRVANAGTAGSGICTIQFKGIQDFDDAAFGGTFPQQYNGIEFQIKLYESNNQIDFVYGNFISKGGASEEILSTIGIKGNTAANAVNVTKLSISAWADAVFINGDYPVSTIMFNNINNQLPLSGQTYRFLPATIPANDLSVKVIYGFGGVARNNSDTIKAVIKNEGAVTQTNKLVSLNIVGAFPFTDTKTIVSIAPGESQVIKFLPYTATTAGNNIATVLVPADNNITNDSTIFEYFITPNIQSVYSGGNVLPVGAIIPTDFVQRFSFANPEIINQLAIGFTGLDAVIYRAAIFDASGPNGTPGVTPIWESGDLISPTTLSFISIPVTPIVSIPAGNYYIGVRQLTNSSAGIAGEEEIPLRIGEIFFREGASSWIDFSTINNFKLAYGVEFSEILPVTITSFKGEKNGNKNLLTWATISENNNKGFELERSKDGRNFAVLQLIESKSVAGFSNRNLSYSFVDEHPFTGTNFYRLKQVDKNGKASFSQIVTINGSKISLIQLTAAYPNPVKNSLNLSIELPAVGKVYTEITDLTGKKMYSATMQLQSGKNSLPVNVSKLPSGNYIVKIIAADGKGEAVSTFIKN